jgi:hypothetical protein
MPILLLFQIRPLVFSAFILSIKRKASIPSIFLKKWVTKVSTQNLSLRSIPFSATLRKKLKMTRTYIMHLSLTFWPQMLIITNRKPTATYWRLPPNKTKQLDHKGQKFLRSQLMACQKLIRLTRRPFPSQNLNLLLIQPSSNKKTIKNCPSSKPV